MNIGSHEAMPPVGLKSKTFSPQPHWKTATSTP